MMKMIFYTLLAFILLDCKPDITPVPCESNRATKTGEGSSSSYTPQNLIGTWYFKSYQDLKGYKTQDDKNARLEFDSNLTSGKLGYVNSMGLICSVVGYSIDLTMKGSTYIYDATGRETKYVKGINESSCYVVDGNSLQLFSKDVDTGEYYIMNFKR